MSEKASCGECGAVIGSGDDGPDCARDVLDRLRARVEALELENGAQAAAIQGQKEHIEQTWAELARARDVIDEYRVLGGILDGYDWSQDAENGRKTERAIERCRKALKQHDAAHARQDSGGEVR